MLSFSTQQMVLLKFLHLVKTYFYICSPQNYYQDLHSTSQLYSRTSLLRPQAQARSVNESFRGRSNMFYCKQIPLKFFSGRKEKVPCSFNTAQSRLRFSSYLVFEVGDGEEEEFEELVEFGERHVAPPLTQDPLVHVLQYPDAAYQEVPRRLAAQHRLPLQGIMGE